MKYTRRCSDFKTRSLFHIYFSFFLSFLSFFCFFLFFLYFFLSFISLFPFLLLSFFPLSFSCCLFKNYQPFLARCYILIHTETSFLQAEAPNMAERAQKEEKRTPTRKFRTWPSCQGSSMA